MLTNKYFIFALRLIIGVVFIYASLDKIAHPDQFAKIIYFYRIVPGSLINIMALLLPWLELITGMMVIVGIWEKSATLVIGGLLAVFIAALSIALTKGIDIECGCMSTTSRSRSPIISLLIRDVLMLVGCVLIIRAKQSFLSMQNYFSGRKETGAVSTTPASTK